MLGLVFALAANQVSPRGLQLAHNYFPGAVRPLPKSVGTNVVVNGTGTNTTGTASNDLLAARIRAQGLQVATSDVVHALYQDPRYAQELVIFVDARDADHYQAGHIPGAYHFDHYRPQDFLPTVLPACMNAEQIVVYCTGGDCEDSEFAAIMLRDAGIPPDRLFVYVGGITAWTAHGWPVETGDRKSGILKTTAK